MRRLLALLDQRRRCSADLKKLQGRLPISAGTEVLPRSALILNFVNTGQDSVYLDLKNCCISAQGKAEPSSCRLPVESTAERGKAARKDVLILTDLHGVTSQ